MKKKQWSPLRCSVLDFRYSSRNSNEKSITIACSSLSNHLFDALILETIIYITNIHSFQDDRTDVLPKFFSLAPASTNPSFSTSLDLKTAQVRPFLEKFG